VAAFLALEEVFPSELAEDHTFQRLLSDALASLQRFGAAAVVASLGY
jgi:hypothetical protein